MVKLAMWIGQELPEDVRNQLSAAEISWLDEANQSIKKFGRSPYVATISDGRGNQLVLSLHEHSRENFVQNAANEIVAVVKLMNKYKIVSVELLLSDDSSQSIDKERDIVNSLKGCRKYMENVDQVVTTLLSFDSSTLRVTLRNGSQQVIYSA